MLQKSDLILPLSNISNDDKDSVGENAANLGEMVKLGIPFPSGFVVTTNAYPQFLLENNLLTITKPVRKIKEGIMSKKLIEEIFRAYKRLERPLEDATVDIYSSFPKKKFKNVKGEANLIQSVKSLWSSFFESSTNHYLSAIVVQKKISPFCSGIMFTIDYSTNNKTKIIIYEGNETGNHYEVSKKNLEIVSKVIEKSMRQVLTDNQIIDLAIIGKKLQEHYYFPQEVRFAVEKHNIYIIKTNPISILDTVIPAKAGIQMPSSSYRGFPIRACPVLDTGSGMKKMRNINNLSTKKPKHKILLKGEMLYPGIATGHLRIIQNTQDINKILRGEVIVIPYQDLIKRSIIKAGAIVATNNRFHHMLRFTHSAGFSGKPALITTPNEARVLKNGVVVTVNGKNGEVYLGSKF